MTSKASSIQPREAATSARRAEGGPSFIQPKNPASILSGSSWLRPPLLDIDRLEAVLLDQHPQVPVGEDERVALPRLGVVDPELVELDEERIAQAPPGGR